MPIYEYDCRGCKRRVSLFFPSFSAVEARTAAGENRCPRCGSADLTRKMSRVRAIRAASVGVTDDDHLGDELGGMGAGLDDIDEDGIREIGLYTSSCVSRYKALRVFALRTGTWREMSSVPFDIHCPDPPKQNRIRKVARGVFEMRYVTEDSRPDYPCTDDQWARDTMR